MKKSILILSAIAGMTYLSSCGSDDKPVDTTLTQMQLDSIQKAQADSAAMANAAVNDSLLKAQQDSLAAANAATAAAANTKTGSKTAKPTVTKPVTTKPTTTKPVAPPPPKPRTQAEVEADKKAARFGDQAAKERVKQDEANKKAARFGDKDAKEKVQEIEADKKASRFNK